MQRTTRVTAQLQKLRNGEMREFCTNLIKEVQVTLIASLWNSNLREAACNPVPLLSSLPTYAPPLALGARACCPPYHFDALLAFEATIAAYTSTNSTKHFAVNVCTYSSK